MWLLVGRTKWWVFAGAKLKGWFKPPSLQFPEPDWGVIPVAPVLPVGSGWSRCHAPGSHQRRAWAMAGASPPACPGASWTLLFCGMVSLGPGSSAPALAATTPIPCTPALGGLWVTLHGAAEGVQDACVRDCSAALRGGCAGGEGDAPLLVFSCQDLTAEIPRPPLALRCCRPGQASAERWAANKSGLVYSRAWAWCVSSF